MSEYSEGVLVSAKDEKALQSLLAKMDAASLPEPTPVTGGLAGGAFCELLKGRVIPPQTGHAWAMLQKALREAAWTEEEARALDLSWAKKPIGAATVAIKGKDWLARQKLVTKVSQPALLFGDEDE
jgi:hypothetical protein